MTCRSFSRKAITTGGVWFLRALSKVVGLNRLPQGPVRVSDTTLIDRWLLQPLLSFPKTYLNLDYRLGSLNDQPRPLPGLRYYPPFMPDSTVTFPSPKALKGLDLALRASSGVALVFSLSFLCVVSILALIKHNKALISGVLVSYGRLRCPGVSQKLSLFVQELPSMWSLSSPLMGRGYARYSDYTLSICVVMACFFHTTRFGIGFAVISGSSGNSCQTATIKARGQ